MMYFFVDNIIQTGCFSFLEKVAEADFYEQSRRHVCRPSVEAIDRVNDYETCESNE